MKGKAPDIIQNIVMSAAMEFLLGTQERVRSSHGKRAISVRATEVLLYQPLIPYQGIISCHNVNRQ